MREMKDSGVEWIGEIPKEWSTIPTKRLFKIESGATPKSENEAYFNGDIPWITPADYKTEDVFVSGGRRNISQLGFESCSTTLIPAGSLIFSKRAPIGAVAINTVDLCTNQGCLSCISKTSDNVKYYYYTMSICTEQYNLLGSGTTFKEISAVNFANFTLVYPPLPEQRRIADYLDVACSKVDALIANQLSQIEKLKAYKQSLITEVVTRGLDPNVPMKDSGVEWIGQIPEGWDVAKQKYHWKNIESGVSVNAADRPADNEEQYCVLKTSSVSRFVFLPNEYKQVDEEEYGRVSCPVKSNSIIASRMNTPDLVGACGYVDRDYPNVFLPDRLWQISYREGIIVKYVWYYLINKKVRQYISSLSTGTSSSMQNISQGQFGDIFIAIPTLDEQQQIADYLDTKCAKIDALIAIKQQKIEKLMEYKKSLIHEYVTGKKEVV